MKQFPSREEEIFAELVALPAAQRTAWMENMCAGDAGMRDRIEALLESHEHARDFLEPPAVVRAAAPPPSNIPQENVGDTIGHYTLLQKLGEGGCGVVYMAEQHEPVRRRVALKIIKLGMDTKEVIVRFEAERQALALMDHPNIARVFDAGATVTGRPFFVMELVGGVPLTTFCDEHNLPTAQRLELFTVVCHAVHHAHRRGIIHRDLKPSNILVTLLDEVPVPKVIDFGVAKATQGRLTDQTLFTAFEQFIGTPAYMSPEQAEFNGLEIDARSDIYSLGVLLYELLTGRPPLDPKTLVAAGLDEVRRIIREVDPLLPSARLNTLSEPDRAAVAKRHALPPARLSGLLRGDLDCVVMKALEKDRARRYESANALALDLIRHLHDEPVAAQAPSVRYRIGKLVRRHRAAAIAFAVLVFAGGAALATWRYFEARLRADLATQTMQSPREMPKQAAAGSLTIFDDTFADGERSHQNPPRSLAWYQSQAQPARFLAVRNGVMETTVMGRSGRSIWAYFPTVNLKVGEAITFTCDFVFTGEFRSEAFQFRFALCDSNGAPRSTSDGRSPAGAYHGYLWGHTGLIRKRDGAAAANPTSFVINTLGEPPDQVWRVLVPGDGTGNKLEVNVPYRGTLTIRRTDADRAQVITNIAGGEHTSGRRTSRMDASNICSRFDTIIFYVGPQSLVGAMLIRRATLTVEPASAAQ